MHYTVKRAIIRPTWAVYMFNLSLLVYLLDFDYVTKMRYNKAQDLVFVTKPSRFWGTEEHVHELHHLEQMVPAPVTAIKEMQDPRGIMTIYDMATKENLKLYKEDKYWNVKLKEQFQYETSGLWLNNHDNKHNGRIFQHKGEQSLDQTLTFTKIDEEMKSAVSKHGQVNLPTSHVKDFYDKIDEKRRQLTNA